MQDDTRINAPGRVPMQSPSSAVNPNVLSILFPLSQSAHTRAASEMSDDDAPVSDLGRNLGQNGSDIFVGQSMKAISLQLRFAEVTRQRNDFGNRRLAAMKAGIEAGDLRDAGHAFEGCLDGS